jgi:hypothetical protein
VAAELASDATTTVLSSTGPDLPAYPGDGQTSCLSRCRCSWKILAHEDRWECWWKLNPAAEHCEECVANARRYDPLIQPWVGV